MKMASKQN